MRGLGQLNDRCQVIVVIGIKVEHLNVRGKSFCEFEGLIAAAAIAPLLVAAATVATTTSSLSTIASAITSLAATTVASAATRVSSTSRVSTTATAVATATSTSTSSTAGISEIDFHTPSIQLLLIEARNGSFGLRLTAIGHKSETTRTAGLAVAHDNRIQNLPELTKRISQRIIGGVPTQIAYVDFAGHDVDEEKYKIES